MNILMDILTVIAAFTVLVVLIMAMDCGFKAFVEWVIDVISNKECQEREGF